MTVPFHQNHFFIDRPHVVMKGNEILSHCRKMTTAQAEAEGAGAEVVTQREAQHRVALHEIAQLSDEHAL